MNYFDIAFNVFKLIDDFLSCKKWVNFIVLPIVSIVVEEIDILSEITFILNHQGLQDLFFVIHYKLGATRSAV